MKCERCKKETDTLKMSWFNTHMLCTDCQSEERSHPEYKSAKDKVIQEESIGNLNYEGAGLPNDLKEKYNL